MTERVKVAIIGSGPAGLSAGGRAAACGISHVVLERQSLFADTIQKYQRGKHVMATPGKLPLRSDLVFQEGSREAVLAAWDGALGGLGINIRYGAEVSKITGRQGAFQVGLAGGGLVEAEAVVLAIGVQGNLRKLTVPGAELPCVQYQLDDPKAYGGERILVVGAGDAAIENALALADHDNDVLIVNRGKEFAKAKPANAAAIGQAIAAKRLECAFEATPLEIKPGLVVLKTRDGRQEAPCDRLIARLGGDPPRRFLEACGVAFPKIEGAQYPEVSTTYESNVKGLYVIGALAGYPLIKHCMNQGYEVIETIAGRAVEPADQPLLAERLYGLPGRPGVDEAIEQIKTSVGLFRGLTTLQLREFLLDSETRMALAGEVLFTQNDYGDTVFCVASGSVVLETSDPRDAGAVRQRIRRDGDFFGEAGLVAGRRRAATARALTDCVLIELARRSAVKLLASVPAAQALFQRTTMIRQLQDDLLPELTEADLDGVMKTAEIRHYEPGKRLIEEGRDDDQSVFLIRSGAVTVSRKADGKDVVLAYEPPGRLIGEMALLRQVPRTATVQAAIATEAIRIDGVAFRGLLEARPELRARVEEFVQAKLTRSVGVDPDPLSTGYRELVERTGVGEGTDVLLIDESLCIRCDNCEKACAESHDGITRLDREAGPTFAMLHVPTSCRHCQHPHCMADCPPDAIHRAPNGEVWIDDTCIGCENCARNCPYGVIQMASPPPAKPGLWPWLLLGLGPGPGEDKSKRHGKAVGKDGQAKPKHAVKCDMCRGIDGGPACVRACPTGAAIRVSPTEFFDAIGQRP